MLCYHCCAGAGACVAHRVYAVQEAARQTQVTVQGQQGLAHLACREWVALKNRSPDEGKKKEKKKGRHDNMDEKQEAKKIKSEKEGKKEIIRGSKKKNN